MNLWRLSLAYLRTQWLTAGLNVLLLALGVATIGLLLLIGEQLEDNLRRDADGFDLVVGAKGSPLQLILSGVYHLDAPTGNVPLAEARRWARHRLVAEAIPVALGDSYRGYRIVGTTRAYPESFDARPAAGGWWSRPLEAVLGARVARESGLAPGDTFVGAHGLGPGGHAHDDRPYRVAGVLAPTHTVLDRLILTDVTSVWAVHGEDPEAAEDGDHGHEAHGHGDDHDHHEHEHEHDADAAPPDILDPGFDARGREITALLLKSDSPLAATTLPRLINSVSGLQAAAPVPEIARLLRLIGFGLDTLRGFAALVIVAAGLSVFVALYNALKARRFDLAVMRSLGASRGLLFRHMLLEGQLIAAAGAAAGLLLAHAAAELLGLWLYQAQGLRLTGGRWLAAEWWLPVLASAVCLAASLLPAWQAYRTDIARRLAQA